MRACLLVYDIPEGSEVPNPSAALRRVGFRANLSCWVIPEERLPWALMDRLTQGGASWHVVRFADEEAESLLLMATTALRRDVEAARKRAGASVGRAGDLAEQAANACSRLDDQAGALDVAGRYARRVRASLRRAERLLEAAEAAARCFGIDPAGLGGDLARATIGALQATATIRARVYAEMAEKVAGTPMATAAADSDVPAGVLADYLEERGEDVGAAREVFADMAVA